MNYRKLLQRQQKQKKLLQNKYLQNYNLTLKYIHILNVKQILNIKIEGQWCRLLSVVMATETTNIDINIKHYMDYYMKNTVLWLMKKKTFILVNRKKITVLKQLSTRMNVHIILSFFSVYPSFL